LRGLGLAVFCGDADFAGPPRRRGWRCVSGFARVGFRVWRSGCGGTAGAFGVARRSGGRKRQPFAF